MLWVVRLLKANQLGPQTNLVRMNRPELKMLFKTSSHIALVPFDKVSRWKLHMAWS